jgi:hypothetical protein
VSLPFILWTMQRTGGTSLTDLLMAMSEHKSAEHEPFNWRTHKPRQFGHVAQQWVETRDHAALETALSGILAERYLIKHCYELHGALFNSRVVRAAAKTDYRHILLFRRDELSRLVSKFIAEANGTWFQDYAAKVYAGILAGKRSIKPLPVDSVVKHFEHCRSVTAQLRELLYRFNVPTREIYYEDLYLGDRAARLARLNDLFEFIGFTPETIAVHHTDIEEKIFSGGQNTADVMPFVPNLEEVKAALARVGYEDDPSTRKDAIGQCRPAKAATVDTQIVGQLSASAIRTRSAIPVNDDDATTIHQRGYRNFVGGANVWETLGNLQFDFLLQKGLRPSDKFIDVACGSLRGGVHFIKYLDPGNYYAIEKHIELVIYGVAKELGITYFREKMPHFVISNSFEFGKIGTGFTFGIAQSLFSHLTASDIRLCLSGLHSVAADGCKFYATFFEANGFGANPATSHSTVGFRYTRSEMENFGTEAGWLPSYLGDWGHPRNQKIMEYICPNRIADR